MEILKSNEVAREILAGINHPATMARVTAERHFLALLQAGCDTPVGVDSVIEGDEIKLEARVFEEDGSHRASSASGPLGAPEKSATELYRKLK